MGKIKEIKKAAPQQRQGQWWFDVTLDNGEKCYYAHESEEPFKAGDELPPYEIKDEATGRGGSRKMLVILATPDKRPVEAYTYSGVDKTTTILSAKARACIDAMGYATAVPLPQGKKLGDVYGVLVKLIHSELDKL